jgi:alpha-L-rhamnosidase
MAAPQALALTTAPAALAAPASSVPVDVVDLSVNQRFDEPLGIGDARPELGWRMTSAAVPGNPCYDPTASGPCALSRQTSYEVEAASSVEALTAGDLIWDSGRVRSRDNSVDLGVQLDSRDTVAWRVRVWDATQKVSAWSAPSTFSVGLLEQGDWGQAEWIEEAGRAEGDPLPIFARQFEVPEGKELADARLYLSGAGLHHATVNGEEITDEVLAPGNTNYQLSTEYRTYDISEVLEDGDNTVGVELGTGTAYVRRSVLNPAVGRTSPYAWWQSQLKGTGTLAADAPVGATNVKVSSVASYHVGGTINVDTGDGGDRLESRVITEIGTAGVDGTGISFTPALGTAHASGALVTGSGNNIAASDPSAGAAVTPRMIARIELDYTDGSSEAIVSNRDWRVASGPTTTTAWYAGEDYDARREQAGWNEAGADLTTEATRRDGSAMDWTSAGIAPPPNLATELVARDAEVMREMQAFVPKKVTNPVPGTWVFDFGQNFAGWPELKLPQVPAGTVVKMFPAEGLNADGTVNQSSLGPGGRGRDLFNSYIATGAEGGETWTPKFNYFGMQYVQVTGLPEGLTPDASLITGHEIHADIPMAGNFASSNARMNRLHTMFRYSFTSNMMSTFTDCPGREKQSYPADYTAPMQGLLPSFDLRAYMRTTMRHLVEGQSRADTPMFGNVALKTPVHDWGYTGRFGDEINWGNGIVLVPYFLYRHYGATDMMDRYWDNMVDFVDYIRREKAGTGADEHIVNAALSDWVSVNNTDGRITGTWGYYLTIHHMAEMARALDRPVEAREYDRLADDIKRSFNDHFLNEEGGYYSPDGTTETGATQSAQAFALDSGLVPEEHREAVLDFLVDHIYSFDPQANGGPHIEAGHIGLAPLVRVLRDSDRADVLWDVLQQDGYPSYGYFLQSTPRNPDGFTTMGERWTRSDSSNHMILIQIEEWFQGGVAGLKEAADAKAGDKLVFKPQPVGNVQHAETDRLLPNGTAAVRWEKTDGRFSMKVTVPANTTAEVWVPTQGRRALATPTRATFERVDGDYAVYSVGAGSFEFVSARVSYEDIVEQVDQYAADDVLDEADAAGLREQVVTAMEYATDGSVDLALASVEAYLAAVAGLGDAAPGYARTNLTELGEAMEAELLRVGAVPAAEEAPANTAAPTVQGEAVVGRTLTAQAGTWDTPGLQFAYQWNRNGAPIDGATGRIYTLVAADAGALISVSVTATSGDLPPGRATSGAVGPVASGGTPPPVTPGASATTTTLKAPKRVTAGRPFPVRVRVEADQASPEGRVQVRVDGRLVRRARLEDGRVTVRIELTAGKHRVRVVFAGDEDFARSYDSQRVRAVRR